MPAPNQVARKLSESLGSEAADAMVDWMNRTEGATSELRADIAELRQETKADIAALRQETKADIAELRHEMNVRFADFRQEVNVRFAELREEMRSGFANVNARFAAADAAAAQRHADFMKWTLGFWAVSLVTLVGAIAAFSRLLP